MCLSRGAAMPEVRPCERVFVPPKYLEKGFNASHYCRIRVSGIVVSESHSSAFALLPFRNLFGSQLVAAAGGAGVRSHLGLILGAGMVIATLALVAVYIGALIAAMRGRKPCGAVTLNARTTRRERRHL
jgi:hypothetical protein